MKRRLIPLCSLKKRHNICPNTRISDGQCGPWNCMTDGKRLATIQPSINLTNKSYCICKDLLSLRMGRDLLDHLQIYALIYLNISLSRDGLRVQKYILHVAAIYILYIYVLVCYRIYKCTLELNIFICIR